MAGGHRWHARFYPPISQYTHGMPACMGYCCIGCGRVYVRTRYGSDLVAELKALGAHWDRDEKAWWVGSGKRDQVIGLITTHPGDTTTATTVLSTVPAQPPVPPAPVERHYVRTRYEDRDLARAHGGTWDPTRRQWCFAAADAAAAAQAAIEARVAAEIADAAQRLRADRAAVAAATERTIIGDVDTPRVIRAVTPTPHPGTRPDPVYSRGQVLRHQDRYYLVLAAGSGPHYNLDDERDGIEWTADVVEVAATPDEAAADARAAAAQTAAADLHTAVTGMRDELETHPQPWTLGRAVVGCDLYRTWSSSWEILQTPTGDLLVHRAIPDSIEGPKVSSVGPATAQITDLVHALLDNTAGSVDLRVGASEVLTRPADYHDDLTAQHTLTAAPAAENEDEDEDQDVSVTLRPALDRRRGEWAKLAADDEFLSTQEVITRTAGQTLEITLGWREKRSGLRRTRQWNLVATGDPCDTADIYGGNGHVYIAGAAVAV